MEKIRLGVSSCLLGNKVRYDGGHKLDRYLTETLGRYVEWVPVCPEVEYGLSIPREAMRLAGTPEAPRLVTIRTGIDHTEGMLRWVEGRLRELEDADLCGFVFKGRSPSSGMRAVKVYLPSGIPSHKGVGIFAGVFMKHFPLVPVEEDGRLQDPTLRENFLERVFVFWRWRKLSGDGGRPGGLVDFHTDHKLLILSHSPKHYTTLGRLVAHAADPSPESLQTTYLQALMEGLKLTATAKKNANVLQHSLGYFKQQLSADEKQELLEVIDQYRNGFLPLIVPIVLLRHYTRKYDQPYLKRQYYLHPHPSELMLRNHT